MHFLRKSSKMALIGSEKMFNSHVHTQYSHDCSTPMEAMFIAAIREKVSGIAITDHCNADFCVSDNSYMNILKSANEARLLRDKYSSQLKVGVGIELSDVLRKKDYAARLMKAIKPDCVIISVHNLMINNLPAHISRMNFANMSDCEAYDIIRMYFSDLAATVKEADFDICAHLTLPLRYTNGVYGKKLALRDFTTEIEKILSTLIGRQKALEINTSDVHHQLFDFMPGEDIVSLYYNMGGRLVTIGTDAHLPQNISSGFTDAQKMLKKIGFDSYMFYQNRKPLSIPL